jgi:hypothetical protein
MYRSLQLLLLFISISENVHEFVVQPCVQHPSKIFASFQQVCPVRRFDFARLGKQNTIVSGKSQMEILHNYINNKGSSQQQIILKDKSTNGNLTQLHQ